MGLSPPLHWVTSSVAEEPDSRVAVYTTVDVALEGSVGANSGNAFSFFLRTRLAISTLQRLSSLIFVCN